MSIGVLTNKATQGRQKSTLRWAALAMVLALPSVFAETIRVTAWDMEAQADGTHKASDKSIQESAAALSRTNADVILLRHVRDWQTCAQLVQALQPAKYNVLVCSAFRAAQGSGTNLGQVAILAKAKAYFCWSEPWRSEEGLSGGFAFAAIKMGKRRVGFFSAQLDERMFPPPDATRAAGTTTGPSAQARQWEAEMNSLRNWTTNRIEAVVVAGGFGDHLGSAETRRADDFLSAPLDHAATQFGPNELPEGASHYFPARLASNSQTLPGVVLDHDEATCDLDSNPTSGAPATAARAEAPSENSNPTSGAVARAPVAPMAISPSPGDAKEVVRATPPQLLGWLWGTLGVLAVCGGTVWLFSKRWANVTPPTAAAKNPGAENSKSMATAETVVIMARPITGSGTDPGATSTPPRGAIHVEASAVTQTQSGHWQQRAWAAEQRAERANAVMRSGLLALWGQWLREKLVRRLINDRTELLRAQHEATLKAMAVDERLAKIEVQLQRQNQAYERRIEELTRELAVAKEGQRDLIRAQIDQVKAEMDAARTRARAESKEKEGT